MRVVSCLSLITLAVLYSACLEMPITHVSKTDNPVVVPDAGEDGADPLEVCRACLAAPEEPGPGCKTTYDACVGEPPCKLMIQCAFDERCLLGPQKGFFACALPCLDKAGVKTSDDKIISFASNLFQCLANGPCGDVCFSGD
jgi:hypothetical protein